MFLLRNMWIICSTVIQATMGHRRGQIRIKNTAIVLTKWLDLGLDTRDKPFWVKWLTVPGPMSSRDMVNHQYWPLNRQYWPSSGQYLDTYLTLLIQTQFCFCLSRVRKVIGPHSLTNNNPPMSWSNRSRYFHCNGEYVMCHLMKLTPS